MKKILFLHMLVIYAMTSFSQGFINGDFESTTAGCEINIDNNIFNTLMPNCYAIGTAGSNLDILNSDSIICSYGNAQSGNYFIGIAYNGNREALSLALNSQLIAGESYLLSFYNKKDLSWTSNKLEIGYSLDSVSFGTTIDTIQPTTNTWNQVYLNFSPINNSKFITVRVVDNIYSWNHIDHFSLEPATSIDEFGFKKGISIFPNPFSNQLTFLIADNEQTTATLYDLLGQQVLQQTVTNSTTINTEQLPCGIYLYELRNDKGAIKNGKVLKQ